MKSNVLNTPVFSKPNTGDRRQINSTSFILKTIAGVALASAITTAYAAVAPISTQGNQVLIGGNSNSIAGMSLYYSNKDQPISTIYQSDKFYNPSVVAWLKQDWNANIIRVPIRMSAPGDIRTDREGNLARIKTVIDAAIANDMYVVVAWEELNHSSTSIANIDAKISFYQEIARTYGDSNNVIYEVLHAPRPDVKWNEALRPQLQSIVDAIRTLDPDNLIVAGTPNWSWYPGLAAENPLTGINIAYDLTIDANSSDANASRDSAQNALNSGLPLFVSEFNFRANTPLVDVEKANIWREFIQSNKLNTIGFAIHDSSSDPGINALFSGASGTGNWLDSDLTESGSYLKNLIKTWPSITPPKTCTEVSLPGILQAENHCSITDTGIYVGPTTDVGGGDDVAFRGDGGRLTYAVKNLNAGDYLVTYRVASAHGGAEVQLENADGTARYSTKRVPMTGGWGVWADITDIVSLPAGAQEIALKTPGGFYSINWIRFDPIYCEVDCNPFTVTKQAEDWEVMRGVKTQNTTDLGGGLNVGWLDAGDWISWGGAKSINIPETGIYRVEFRVASLNGGGSFNFEKNGGSPVYASNISVPKTNGWQNWQTISFNVKLNAGTQGFGMKVNSGGFNVNWFKLTKM
jgi:endoglucanase